MCAKTERCEVLPLVLTPSQSAGASSIDVVAERMMRAARTVGQSQLSL